MFLRASLLVFCTGLALSSAVPAAAPAASLRDEDTTSSDPILAFFRRLNTLTSDSLLALAHNLKQSATENPTEETLKQLKAATAILKNLEKSKKVYDEAEINGRGFFGSLAKGLGKLAKFGIENAPAIIDAGKGIAQAVKGQDVQQDQQDVPQDVLIMDEQTGDVIQAKGILGTLVKVMKPVAKWGLKKVIEKVQGGNSEQQDEMSQSDNLQYRVFKALNQDLKIAATLNKDGPLADFLDNYEGSMDFFPEGKSSKVY